MDQYCIIYKIKPVGDLRVFCVLILLAIWSAGELFAQEPPFTAAEREAIASSVVQIVVSGDDPRQGSGVIVSSDGLIFTNAHVVEGADQIRVALFDGFRSPPELRYTARIRWISTDSSFDFAVLEINGDGNGRSVNTAAMNLPYIRAWNEEVDIMDQVIFFTYQTTGNNFMVITTGTVTTLQTRPVGGQIRLVIQSDADFSTNGSGGLVVNKNGQFIGIPWEVEQDPTGKGGYLTYILPLDTVCAIRSQECAIRPTNLNIQPAPTVMPSSTTVYFSGTVNTPRLNLRSQPSADGYILFRISQGDTVDVLGRNSSSTWILIDAGVVGWVNASYIYTSASLDSLPVYDSSIVLPDSRRRIVFECPGARGPSFRIGDRFVVPRGDGPTSVWAEPNGPPRITSIEEGLGGTIRGGPICTGGQRGNLVFWYVTADTGHSGYISEGYLSSPIAWIKKP